MSHTYTETQVLCTSTCYKCGVLFAMPNWFKEKRQDDGEAFYCPNGHGQVYGEGRLEKLRKQLAAQERMTAEARSQVQQEKASREQIERSFKKHRRRVSNGVCPCCNGSFVDLERHMKSQHPDAVVPATTPIK